MELSDKVKGIKREFFAYRNGMLADSLRNLGYPYTVIFGLNVPQLAGIWKDYGSDTRLADTLWEERHVRESRLMACYLFNPEEISEQKALTLALDVQTQEEADMLSFRLLKRLAFSRDILKRLSEEEGDAASLSFRALSRHLA